MRRAPASGSLKNSGRGSNASLKSWRPSIPADRAPFSACSTTVSFQPQVDKGRGSGVRCRLCAEGMQEKRKWQRPPSHTPHAFWAGCSSYVLSQSLTQGYSPVAPIHQHTRMAALCLKILPHCQNGSSRDCSAGCFPLVHGSPHFVRPRCSLWWARSPSTGCLRTERSLAVPSYRLIAVN